MVEIVKAHAGDLPFPRNYASKLLVLDRGEGVYLFDVDGKKYLDFGSGIAVNALGHGRDKVAEIVAAQMKKLIHVSNLYTTEPALELGNKLIGTGNFAAVHLGNSGSEANEAALKYARLYARRTKGEGHHKILSFQNAFHGRTMGSLSVTPTEKYREPFGPLLSDCTVLPFNDEEALTKTLDDTFAAVIVEPVQGEGGLSVMTPDFTAALNRLCAEKDVILIADEVQTGLGRTGEFYGSAVVGLKPDIITLAKPLAAGLPLSATLIPEKINKLLHPGDHGTTFGGGPVTCAAANYVVDMIFHPRFLQAVQLRSRTLTAELTALASRFACLGDVKGLGLMQGVEVVEPEDQKGTLTAKILSAAQEEGLLLLRTGASTLRILPPLVITDDEIREGISILEKTLKKMGL